MSVNVRKGRPYTDQNHSWTAKGWDVSAGSFHKLMQVLYKKDVMNKWGSIVALSYMAAQRVFPAVVGVGDCEMVFTLTFLSLPKKYPKLRAIDSRYALLSAMSL